MASKIKETRLPGGIEGLLSAIALSFLALGIAGSVIAFIIAGSVTTVRCGLCMEAWGRLRVTGRRRGAMKGDGHCGAPRWSSRFEQAVQQQPSSGVAATAN